MDNEMDKIEAFKNLCIACDMSIILNEDANAKLSVGLCDEEKVVFDSNGEIYDDRGELYEALNRVACALIPNILGRERWN